MSVLGLVILILTIGHVAVRIIEVLKGTDDAFGS